MRGLLTGPERVAVDLEAAYELSSEVAVRAEPFGALAYHYGNRSLNFLRSQEIVDVVENLRAFPSVAATLEASGIARHRWPAFERALAQLEAKEVIHER